MTWRDEAKAAFADLLAYFGKRTEWTDSSGTLHTGLKVLKEEPTQQMLGDMQLSDQHAMDFDPDHFPGIKRGDPITIDAIAFTVREITTADDGFAKHASLTKT